MATNLIYIYDDIGLPPQAAAFVPNEESAWHPPLMSAPFVFARVSYPDDEGWVEEKRYGSGGGMTIITLVTRLPRPTLFTDDEILPVSAVVTPVEQEEGWAAQTQFTPWQARPFADDEYSTNLANFYLEQEDAWVASYQAQPWLAKAFTDEDLLFFVAADQEEPWVAQTQRISWTAQPFLDDEISTSLANFYLETEDAWPALRETVAWIARPSLDDEIQWFVAPTLAAEDEQPFVALRETVAWTSRPFADDETGARLANFYTDQEEHWTALREVIPWTARPALDDEISTALANFAREQEEPWIAAVQVRPWLRSPFLDDETSANLANFYLEDEGRAALVSWPWPLLAAPVFDEPVFVAALPFDDDAVFGLRQIPVQWVARPASDDEVSTNLANFYLDHEAAGPMLATPYVYQAAPIFDDSTVIEQVAFGLDQEDDWNRQRQLIPWTAFVPFEQFEDIVSNAPATEPDRIWHAKPRVVTWNAEARDATWNARKRYVTWHAQPPY